MTHLKQSIIILITAFLVTNSVNAFSQNQSLFQADTVITSNLGANDASIDQLQSIQLNATNVVADSIKAQSFEVSITEIQNVARIRGTLELADGAVIAGEIISPQGIISQGGIVLPNLDQFLIDSNNVGSSFLAINAQGNVMAYDLNKFSRDLAAIIHLGPDTLHLDDTPIVAQSISVSTINVVDELNANNITAQQISVGSTVLDSITRFRGEVYFDGSNIFNGATVFETPVEFGSEVTIDTLLRVNKIAAANGAIDVNSDMEINGDLTVTGTTHIKNLKEAEIDVNDPEASQPVFVGVDQDGELKAISPQEAIKIINNGLGEVGALDPGVGTPGVGGGTAGTDGPPYLPEAGAEKCFYNNGIAIKKTPNAWYTNGAESIFTGACWNNISKVGINTQLPQYTLDIAGQGRFQTNLAVGNFSNVNGGPGFGSEFNMDAYQMQVRGKIRLAAEWGVSGTNDAGERYELSNNGEQSHIYLGDNHHFLARRIYYAGQQGADIKNGVYLKTFRNNGLFLKENGGIGIGFDPKNLQSEETPKAILHIKQSEYTRELPYFRIVDENRTDVLLVDNNKRLYATDITVQEPNFPDYVFESDYRLRSLSETENYIKEHKRLPNMPSARQVASEGMDLGEVTKLLVEKVEELTLHLIQMEKENQKLKEKVQFLTENN